MQTPQISQFIHSLKDSIQANTFVKLSLAKYYGEDTSLKNIYIRKVIIRDKVQFSFTYRYKLRDVVKNYDMDVCFDLITKFLGHEFSLATLVKTSGDLQLEFLGTTKVKLRNLQVSHTEVPEMDHDRKKLRHIDADHKTYLADLGISTPEGKVKKESQDKYRQINHYIELLKPILNQLSKDMEIEILDMGSGKGYLTFALYDYILNNLGLKPKIIGVEVREPLVNLCNEIAVKNGFLQLRFKKGNIEDFVCEHIDILIALHACDTATDDAIYKGITANAAYIVVAPCCHQQIRKEMEISKKSNELDFILRHGVYLERQAEMITDSIRALILEYYGYKIKILEFISEAHTPKNIMIIAEKTSSKGSKKSKEVLQKIQEAKNYFGINKHYLEQKLGI